MWQVEPIATFCFSIYIYNQQKALKNLFQFQLQTTVVFKICSYNSKERGEEPLDLLPWSSFSLVSVRHNASNKRKGRRRRMKKGGGEKKRRRKMKRGERGSGRNSKFHCHCQCESNLIRLGTNLTSSMSFKVLQTLEETWGKGLKGCLILTFLFLFLFFQVS